MELEIPLVAPFVPAAPVPVPLAIVRLSISTAWPPFALATVKSVTALLPLIVMLSFTPVAVLPVMTTGAVIVSEDCSVIV